MTERIDLGDELADFDEPKNFGDPTRKPGYSAGQLLPSGGSITPLADLQASGFNTTPPDGYGGGAIWPPDDTGSTQLQLHHSSNSWTKIVGGYTFTNPTFSVDIIPDGFEEIGRIDD
jgi:hypothetical protein